MKRLLSARAPVSWILLSTIVAFGGPASAQAPSAKELVGLWHAKKRFGPDIRGTLIVRQDGSEWRGEISGQSGKCVVDGDAIAFELPGGQGKLIGKFDARRTAILGHWFQAPTRFTSNIAYASPVTLTKHGRHFLGTVTPVDETFVFYLVVQELPDGSMGAFLRNPERNLGRFIRVDHLERDGEKIKLIGGEGTKKRVWVEGVYRNELMTIDLLDRGGNYDFRRVKPGEPTDFYPRRLPGVTYTYSPPPQLKDGWTTASLEQVGLNRAAIEKFMQAVIDTPLDSIAAQEDHGILIARHGKLVLEEYFHGEHREKPHDTRSAAKSIAADLIGAAIHAGVPVSPSTPVYSTMFPDAAAADPDARKKAITLEHLLMMSSGLDCDDNDENSPGFEDKMWEQTEEPDFYRWTLNLKMVRAPGEKMVYCSASPNLAGGVLSRVAKESGPALFHRLLAVPLDIERYYLTTSPNGMFTLTGGSKFLPRDFLKLAQVHVNDGTWNGRRIYTAEWSRRSTKMYVDTPELKYGYLWWGYEYPFRGKTIRGYSASGNGGQYAMAIPELGLAFAFWGGGYNDRTGRTATTVYVPKFILPAVER